MAQTQAIESLRPSGTCWQVPIRIQPSEHSGRELYRKNSKITKHYCGPAIKQRKPRRVLLSNRPRPGPGPGEAIEKRGHTVDSLLAEHVS